MSASTPPPESDPMDGQATGGHPLPGSSGGTAGAMGPPPPDYVQGGPGGQPPYQPPNQPPPSSPGASRGAKAVILAAVLTVLLAGGAFAFYKVDPLHLFRAGPQAAEAIPAGALFYAGVDLDPTAAQKVSALRFLNHFPAFRKSSGLDDANADVRTVIFSKTVETLHCPALTYDSDVKPWIGSKFGIAAMPPSRAGSSPIGVGALEVTDKAAAKAGLVKIRSCLPATARPAFGFAFVGDFVLVAQTQAQADTYAKQAESSSLADNVAFAADMDSLGDLGVATVWANVSGAIDAFGQQMSTGGQLGFLNDSYRRVAATFRFTGDSAEVATSIYGDTPSVDHGVNQIVRLPDSTSFALSEAGGGQRVAASWKDLMKAAGSQSTDVEAQIARFQAQTGLKLPDDLETVLGDNLLFALDSNGLTADALQRGDFSSLDAGVRFTNDPAKLDAIYAKVRALIERQTSAQLPVAKVDAADGMALASNDGYAKTLAGLDGNLGDSPEFQSVTEDAASKEFVLFFNWDSVEAQILTAARDSGASQEVVDNLRPLRALGATSTVDGHYTVATLRLSVND